MLEVSVVSDGTGISVPQLCKQAGLTASTSEALRLIEQRGLKLDGSVKAMLVPKGATVVVQAGKRKFARVTVS